MGPRVPVLFIIKQMSHSRWNLHSKEWQKAIVEFGQATTDLQRAHRLMRCCNHDAELKKEVLNPGHTNWEPLDHPDMLLLEIESNMLLRDVQEEIAALMRAPPDAKNSVVQLDIGGGKTSFILPGVASHAANGEQVVRLFTTGSQIKELHRMLIKRLGDLLDHQIYMMPFSRELKISLDDARTIAETYKTCMNHCGIMLVQPEHVLSLRLMALERLITGDPAVGNILIDIESFCRLHCRDFVDESDEVFSVKFELTYTMGIQNSIEQSPIRWTTIQEILASVPAAITATNDAIPASIEIISGGEGSFPRATILEDDARVRVMESLVDMLCTEGVRGIPVAQMPHEVRRCLLEYISCEQLTTAQICAVEDNPRIFSESTRYFIFLFRGLFVGSVLPFSLFEKRYRVNYGRDLDRDSATRLAVPYRAKDNPTARSEFSHPDVLIALTCLKYYYRGLSDSEFRLAFNLLERNDQAEDEYLHWTRAVPSLPLPFRKLAGINLHDPEAFSTIFRHLRVVKNVIDFYLAKIVFPREMKEFPQKLSASGWDLGEVKSHPTTGFSGTNDLHPLLPLEVHYLDMESQRHTNALVMNRILRPCNGVERLTTTKDAHVSVADQILVLLKSTDWTIRVVLDVGAQVLEYANLHFVQRWLSLIPEGTGIEPGVYFDGEDNICVVEKGGYIEKLQYSCYFEKLDLCVVFMDEAHTRGTDLKLSADYKAAVILGPQLTKDKLVQGEYGPYLAEH
jgi:hypothetical protein